MTHIDDWLDNPLTGPAEVKEWLEHFRRQAIHKDYEWLNSRKLFCTYKDGNRYRCIGCSRMGDVWLTKHFDRENGYDLRIDIDDCTDWAVTYVGIEAAFTPDVIEAIYAAWHGAGVDIAGGNWDRFVGMLPTSTKGE